MPGILSALFAAQDGNILFSRGVGTIVGSPIGPLISQSAQGTFHAVGASEWGGQRSNPPAVHRVLQPWWNHRTRCRKYVLSQVTAHFWNYEAF